MEIEKDRARQFDECLVINQFFRKRNGERLPPISRTVEVWFGLEAAGMC